MTGPLGGTPMCCLAPPCLAATDNAGAGHRLQGGTRSDYHLAGHTTNPTVCPPRPILGRQGRSHIAIG